MAGMTPEELGRLIDEHAAALELYASQWTNSSVDVVQEAFVELFRTSVLPDKIVAWLFRVVRNRAVNAARSEARRRHHERYAATISNWFQADSADAAEAAEAAEMLAELPTEQREVIVARIWGQLNFEQIAELIEASVSTAHRRYNAGIESLRKRMSKPWLTNEMT